MQLGRELVGALAGALCGTLEGELLEGPSARRDFTLWIFASAQTGDRLQTEEENPRPVRGWVGFGDAAGYTCDAPYRSVRLNTDPTGTSAIWFRTEPYGYHVPTVYIILQTMGTLRSGGVLLDFDVLGSKQMTRMRVQICFKHASM